jgi:hypothetical protein
MLVSEQLHLDRFTASARQVLQSAQHQAAQMQAQEVYPEHLLLGVLAQDDDEAAEVLSRLGMNMQVLRAQAAHIFEKLDSAGLDERSIPLSQEAQACIDWAISFAEQRDVSSLSSAYILLGAVRHQRVQPVLALLLSSVEALPTYIAERRGLAYTYTMDQLIEARLDKLSESFLDNEALTRAGIKIERPTITFVDILGADTAKQELRDVITFLRRSVLLQRSGETVLYDVLHGVLLVGHPCTERTLLVQATAGEAIVPLVSLSLTALADRLIGADKNEATREGRSMIGRAFEQAKRGAPSLLLLDDLDALERLGTKNEYGPLLNQLLVEMDGLDPRPPVVVVATTYKLDTLEPALTYPGHFDRRIIVSGSFAVHPAARTKLCLSCKREVLSNWKYCIYCGASVLKACPICGAPHVEVEGARYCFECGSARWSA